MSKKKKNIPVAPVKPDPQTKKNINIIDKIFSTPHDDKPVATDAENARLIIKEWLDPKHITRKTRYTKKQVIGVSILQSLADTYKIETLQRFLRQFRTNKLSEEGKSSQELENILKSRTPEAEETQLQKFAKYLE